MPKIEILIAEVNEYWARILIAWLSRIKKGSINSLEGNP
jgi:hypothetical protein